MLNHTDLKKGALFIYNRQPHEVLNFSLNFQGRGSSTVTVKVKNLITGAVLTKTFHTGDSFEEAEIIKKQLKFLYFNRGQYFFCEPSKPSERFSLTEKQIGEAAKFLKQNTLVNGLVFEEKIINIELPAKVQLKVKEAAPCLRAGRAEAGTKQVTLETGATVNTPIFINEGDVIEINPETGEYVRRIEG